MAIEQGLSLARNQGYTSICYYSEYNFLIELITKAEDLEFPS
jgi:hypothetical protein